MRALLNLAAWGLAMLGAAPAGAADLDFAELRISFRVQAFPSTLLVGTATLPSVDPIGATGSDTYASLVAGDAFAGSTLVQVTPIGTPPFYFDGVRIRVRSNATGLWTGTQFADAATFTGALDVITPSSWGGYMPLAFGGAGTTTQTGFLATAGMPIVAQIFQQPFQTGVVTAGGTALPPIVATGFNSLTSLGEGDVVLVSPMRVTTDLGFQLDAIAELELHYVPEPGTTALLVWGAVALALRARRVAKRRGHDGGR